MLASLDHVVIAVSDLDRATATYSAMLGRSPSWRGVHHDAGSANTLFRLDNTYVELITPGGDGPIGSLLAARLDADGEGPSALAFGTNDLDACVEALRERGVTVADAVDGEGTSADGGRRRWRSAFLSPASARGVSTFAIEHLSPVDALPVAEPTGPRPAVVFAIDHVVVMTSAPDDAIAFYRDKLGIRLALDKTFDERGLRLLFFRIGGITVECAAAMGRQDAPGSNDRFWGISYRVGDVDAARARVAAAGFDVSEVRAGMKPGTRVCTVRAETHGVATLLIEPATARGSA